MLVVTFCNPAVKIQANLQTFRKELVYLVVMNSNLNGKRANLEIKNISTVMGNDFSCP